MKALDEIKITKQLKRIWMEIRFSYMMFWTMGWLFTIGYSSIHHEGILAKAIHALLSLGLWPLFLGYEMAR